MFICIPPLSLETYSVLYVLSCISTVKINIEYISANPTGPLHAGHARGAVFGDALASLLKESGYNVIKEYYINDAGSQIDKLVDSALLRYDECLGQNIQKII